MLVLGRKCVYILVRSGMNALFLLLAINTFKYPCAVIYMNTILCGFKKTGGFFSMATIAETLSS